MVNVPKIEYMIVYDSFSALSKFSSFVLIGINEEQGL